MLFGTSFPANKQIVLGADMKALSKIVIHYRADRRGLYGMQFVGRNNQVIGSIQGNDLAETTREELPLNQNQRFLGTVTTN
jgi:hypothetical protein